MQEPLRVARRALLSSPLARRISSAMTGRTLSLTDSLYDYLVAHSVREPPILARLRQATATLPHATMQIGAEQGQFMALLIKLTAARRCVEVGLALPADGTLVTCDIDPETTAMARQFWREAGMDGRIELRLQPALKSLQELLDAGGAGSFDFAFIDADKTSYRAYYDKLLELVRPGGLIAVDNTLWDGEVANVRANDANTVALRAFNDYVHRDERVDLSLVHSRSAAKAQAFI
jgi:predicted O-methyltransferase YrrM